MKPDDPLLKRYHEASAHDPARPGPALRDNVLGHARAAAATRLVPGAGRPRAANESTWRWRALGGLAVLGLASLLVMQLDRGLPDERAIALGESAAPQATVPSGKAQAEHEAPPPGHAKPASPPAPAQPPPTPPRTPPGAAADAAAVGRDAPATARAPEGASTEQRARSAAREEAPAALSTRRAAPAAPGPSPNDALLGAAARGTIDGVREALAQGADVNAADAIGRSALMLAAQRGDAPLVRLLIDAGADPRHTDRDGLRAADLAQQAGHHTLLPLLGGIR